MSSTSPSRGSCRPVAGLAALALLLLAGEVRSQSGPEPEAGPETRAVRIDPTTGARVVDLAAGEVPRWLYHWARPERLLETAALARDVAGPWPGFPALGGRSRFASSSFPQFADRPGLFTWTNPATATLGGRFERYGEVLVRFEIRADRARAVMTEGRATDDCDRRLFAAELPVNEWNLVFNRFACETVSYQEWIVLDPGVIAAFTADPDVLRPEVERMIACLRSPEYVVPRNQVHVQPFSDLYDPDGQKFNEKPTGESTARNYAVFRLSRYLSDGRSLVPDFFLRDESGRPRSPTARSKDQILGSLRRFRLDEAEVYMREKVGVFAAERAALGAAERVRDLDPSLVKQVVARLLLELIRAEKTGAIAASNLDYPLLFRRLPGKIASALEARPGYPRPGPGMESALAWLDRAAPDPAVSATRLLTVAQDVFAVGPLQALLVAGSNPDLARVLEAHDLAARGR